MGNAPLSSPPRPLDNRVVIPITTHRRVLGTKLHVLPALRYVPPSHNNGGEHTPGGVRTASITPVAVQEEETAGTSSSLPCQLRDGPVSSQEYHEKMRQLEERLAVWRGGRATLALMCLSIFFMLGFFIAYFTPSFWRSPMFHHPGYIMGVAIVIVSVFAFGIRYIRRESMKLQADVEDIYRDWRGRGVHVYLKKVANVGGIYTVTQHGIRRQGGSSGPNCYVIVMNLASEAGDMEDAVSVGTINTDDSRESGDDDDDSRVETDEEMAMQDGVDGERSQKNAVAVGDDCR
jgi:uncharacterized membrane protein (DUF485 family)